MESHNVLKNLNIKRERAVVQHPNGLRHKICWHYKPAGDPTGKQYENRVEKGKGQSIYLFSNYFESISPYFQ